MRKGRRLPGFIGDGSHSASSSFAAIGNRAGMKCAASQTADNNGVGGGGDSNSNGRPFSAPRSSEDVLSAAASKKLSASFIMKSVDESSRSAAVGGGGGGYASSTSSSSEPGTVCIIESVDGIKEFEEFDLKEISSNIQIRRSRIFLLMEEVRRLRIEQRLKGGESTPSQELAEEKFVSALPFLPPLEENTLNLYYYVYVLVLILAIVFGGIIAPFLEVKLGVGGASYEDWIESIHLPSQMAQVDPIVASFCGGAVGVLSALLLVEVNNFKKQIKCRCHYCKGTGYLLCGNCVGTGTVAATGRGCIYCARSGKVMCTGCLCTGKLLATEHDPRIDPFD